MAGLVSEHTSDCSFVRGAIAREAVSGSLSETCAAIISGSPSETCAATPSATTDATASNAPMIRRTKERLLRGGGGGEKHKSQHFHIRQPRGAATISAPYASVGLGIKCANWRITRYRISMNGKLTTR